MTMMGRAVPAGDVTHAGPIRTRSWLETSAPACNQKESGMNAGVVQELRLKASSNAFFAASLAFSLAYLAAAALGRCAGKSRQAGIVAPRRGSDSYRGDCNEPR